MTSNATGNATGGSSMKDRSVEIIWKALDRLNIELPSWGFANTGTRFGKFIQPAAATSIEEKFSDAAQVHALHRMLVRPWPSTSCGTSPRLDRRAAVAELARSTAFASAPSIPNIFRTRTTSSARSATRPRDPPAGARAHPRLHRDRRAPSAAAIFRSGSPTAPTIPAQQTSVSAGAGSKRASRKAARTRSTRQRLLVEYKPFEPAFYHTDIADWGMASLLAKNAGPQAKVLVDTGHHYQAQNIEQIVAWLLDEDMLGGFHFNDRRYADDDLTLGSIDPYQVFRIFHEIRLFEWETGRAPTSPTWSTRATTSRGKIEAMIQTVCTAQELCARAALVDHAQLAKYQQSCSLIDAEETLRGAFWHDVRPAVRDWRESKGLPEDPMEAFRSSGYLERIIKERAEKNVGASASYA